MGYMGATVHLDKKTRKNKLKLAYRIHAGHPYKVRHVVYDIDDLVISDYMRQDSAQSLLAPGMLFDVNVLDAERRGLPNYCRIRVIISSTRIFWSIRRIRLEIPIW